MAASDSSTDGGHIGPLVRAPHLEGKAMLRIAIGASRREAVKTLSAAVAFAVVACGSAGAQCLDWANKTPAGGSPAARFTHMMAYDAARSRTVLFGGVDGTTFARYNDTWLWDGSAWTIAPQNSPNDPAQTPSPRESAAIAYDSDRNVTVMFGGFDSLGRQSDLWEFDGSDWVKRTTTGTPSTRYVSAMVYDSIRHIFILFGGATPNRNGETWEFNPASGAWTQHVVSGPPARFRHSMAFDASRGVVVLYGGFTTAIASDTWELNPATWVWTQKTPATNPGPRQFFSMNYDSSRNVVVLFGGESPAYQNSTWEWNGTNWSQRATAASPAARSVHAAAYDSARAALVMFGGDDASPTGSSETWELAACAAPACPADINNDGQINLTDLAQLLSNFGIGSGATRAMGDIDGDGDVDLTDLSTMLTVFGTACPT